MFIVGAGMSAICTGIKLREKGIDFVMAEKSVEPGGTWRDNRYPDCACDIPFAQYTFSFEPHITDEVYAPSSTIQEYMLHCCTKYNLMSSIRCGTTVESCVWDPVHSEWVSRTYPTDGGASSDRRDVFRSKFLVCAVGQLSYPKIPSFPGRDQVEVPAFHSAEWDESGASDHA